MAIEQKIEEKETVNGNEEKIKVIKNNKKI